MILNNNLIKTKSINYNKVSYATFEYGLNTDYDENLTPIKYSRNTYNFNFSSGSLKTGLGIEPLKIYINPRLNDEEREFRMPDSDVLGIWMLKDKFGNIENFYNILAIYCSDKYVKYAIMYANTVGFAETGLKCQTLPNVSNYFLNGKNVLIFTSPEDPMYIFAADFNDIQIIYDAPNITNMCVHSERLFATVELENDVRNEVWFSDDLDPTNWNVSSTEAGFIKMVDERGSLNTVISFNNYIYIFRDYGITRLTAYGEQSEFNLSHIYLTSSKIISKTVTVCGDRIMFATKDEIFAFDGLNVSSVNLKIKNMLNVNDNSVGAFHNGKYYLATKLNFNDDEKIGCENEENFINNALLEYDIKTGNIEILRGVDICNLNAINDEFVSKLAICIKRDGKYVLGQLTHSGTVFGEPTTKMWKSPLSDFGYPNLTKIVKEVYVKTSADFELIIETEKSVKSIPVKAKKGVTKIKTFVKGELIALSFKSDKAEIQISDPQVVVGLC